jgi:hypothetical protein
MRVRKIAGIFGLDVWALLRIAIDAILFAGDVMTVGGFHNRPRCRE